MSDSLNHKEVEAQAPDEPRLVEEVLGNLVFRIQNQEYDTILEDLKDTASPLMTKLKRAGVDVENCPSQNPQTERVDKRWALLPSRQEAPEDVYIFGWLTDGSGVIPISKSKFLLSMYTPESETIARIRENFGAEFVEELKKSICLMFAEELAHTVQHLKEMKEDGQFFISNEMKDLKPPPVGPARRWSIELDARLYLTNIGFGSLIKDSLWLNRHETVYGETLGLAKWAKVELSPDTLKYF